MSLRLLGLYAMAALYVGAGINHFYRPRMYLAIMPRYLPAPKLLNAAAGLVEMALGVALLSDTLRPWAAWGVVALLFALWPVHIDMLQRGSAAFRLPTWVLVLRLPLQGLLMLWAYAYT